LPLRRVVGAESKGISGAAEDPIGLALHGEKFASVEPEDVERISLEWQKVCGGYG